MISSLSLSLLSTENGLESSDSRLWLEEYLSSQSSSSDVEPVWVVWGYLLGKSSLDIIISSKRSDFLLDFELFSEGSDEGLSGNVFDCDIVSLFLS